ncbi:Arogenate dehydratase/prephenate dehydratase 1, chloroplastic [Glycine soja]
MDMRISFVVWSKRLLLVFLALHMFFFVTVLGVRVKSTLQLLRTVDLHGCDITSCRSRRTRHWALTLSWEKQQLKRAQKCGGDENPWKPVKIVMRVVDHHPRDGDVSYGLHKDLVSLPKPLSISDIVAASDDHAKVRISYKGIPGSYSEDAALKAYPNCETVSCNDFEEAFKAVEIWWADKVILPIENTSGGSIHRNYDLLLRHRLHIVGEVQLATNLALLALPGVRTEYLKRAFELSDDFLTKLGVARENVDDTAGAAQIIASNGLYDAGAIASIRAAEIYGLNVLAERIQIESRPQRNRPLRVVDDSNTGTAKYFDYLFYIDFDASMTEPRAQTALGHLQF